MTLWRIIGSSLVAGVLVVTWRAVTYRGPTPSITGQHNVIVQALGERGDMAAYARAMAPRAFEFPADHGPHPEFRNEWWYITGHLATPEGHRFGYQLTLFRIALAPNDIASESRWRTRQLYMAHFAVSDLDAGEFHAFERLARGAAGLAGAETPPLKVWLDAWTLQGADPAGFPLHLTAAEQGVAIDLRLQPLKPVVLHGERGLSRRSPEPGNASYYYSITRLKTAGEVTVGGRRFAVTGTSWLDREWSTSPLAAEQAGWDWFSLQMEDGRDLMIYRLRRTDGSTDPASAGTFVEANGQAVPLTRNELALRALSYWTSPRSGIRYPVRWELSLPKRDLVLRVEPMMANQELELTVHYWEGAVRAIGREGSRKITARGYMELAGYGVGVRSPIAH